MTESIPSLLLDPLFRLPFATGLLVALVLPLIGSLLMLRDEWLAALGLAHLAAASALLGLAAGIPAILGGTLGAVAAGTAKSRLRARGNVAYGFMILIGWSSMLLVAANSAVGDSLGHALIDGQLYFAGIMEFSAALLLLFLVARMLPRLMPFLLQARFFPSFATANRLPAWRWHLGMDLLAAASIAVAITTLGLMGTFGLVLAPAWIAFRIAPSWRWTLILSVVTGVCAYLTSFIAALLLDQPFGPVLVVILVAMGVLVGAIGSIGEA